MTPFKGLAFFILVLVVTGFLAGACTTSQSEKKAGEGDKDREGRFKFGPDAPKWVREGKVHDPEFDSRRYIRGLGNSPPDLPEADAYDLAKLSAFTDISAQIETYVEEEFTSIQRSVFQNEDLDELVDLKSISKQVTKEIFGGVEVIRRYYDQKTGTACVFAVMNRQKFGQRLFKEANEARIALDGYLEAFEQSSSAKDTSQALKDLIHAHQSMEKIIRSHLKTIAAGAPQEPFQKLNTPHLAVKIIKELGAIKDKIRIKAISGNEQKATLTGLLKKPVVVQVSDETGSRPLPLSAFPMQVVVEDEEKGKAIPHGMTTDSNGRFSFDLQELKATGSSSNTVTVQLDFQAVEKQTTVVPPSLEVIYFMPTKDNTRIGALIHETIDGKENPNSYIGSAIKEALTEIGFQVIRVEAESPVRDVILKPRTWLENHFKDQCDYLIVGTAEAEFSSQEEPWYFYHTRLVIDALELDTGKTIHFEVPMGQSTKGNGTTKTKASRDSLCKTADVLVGDPKEKNRGLLAQKFIARFEKGEDWIE